MWVKLDDGFPDNPKIDGLSDGAFRLYVAALCFSMKYLTDGLVPAERVPRLVPRHRRTQTTELLDRGLWLARGDVFEIHDFAEYQKTRAEWETERKRTRARVQRWRERHREEGGTWQL